MSSEDPEIGTHAWALRRELLSRVENYLKSLNDSRCVIETEGGRVLLMHDRRGWVVNLWSRQTLRMTPVLRNVVGSDRTFDPRLAEVYALPELRRRMLLDDMADV